MQPKRIALLAREAAEDKKAEDVVVMDVAKQTSLAHYFLITHGNSEPHIRAIANHIIDVLESKKIRCLRSEGMDSARWVLLDFGSVIVHVFHKEIREFYNLERLWGESGRI